MWLYYHTIGDYKAMGVPAKSVEEMIPLYASKLGLRDEAWEKFRNKLYRYISSENNAPETTTSSVTMPDGTTAEADTTTAEVSEITEEIADTFTYDRPAGSCLSLRRGAIPPPPRQGAALNLRGIMRLSTRTHCTLRR